MTRIIRVPFLVPRWAIAQVLLPNTIFLKAGVTASTTLIAHELVHVDQIQRYGLLAYWVRYLLLLLRYGYEDHPMEIEARALETTIEWRKRAKRVLEVNDA
ncbi:MAG: hypothetical protein RI554_11675 [Trueperaceae bacterium]|nr:hypothetical protein [Trueperaceae bacterium]